jgi:hypothetical protein
MAILLVLPLSMLFAQQQDERPRYREMMEEETGHNFYDIQKAANEFFEQNGTEKWTGWKQFKRWEWFMEQRVYPTGELLSPRYRAFDAYQVEKEKRQNEENQRVASLNGNWTSLGPDTWVHGPSGYSGGIGRLNVLVFDPKSKATMYVGAPDGGCWKTTNGGTTWASISDDLSQLGVSGLAVDPNDPDIIYMLTGDGPGAVSSIWPSIHNIGVLKTTNGGTTWNPTGLTFTAPNSSRGYRLVMSPANSNILIAATNSGLYRTANGGTSWTNVQTSSSWRDIVWHATNSNIVFATRSTGYYRSADAGATWTQITSGLTSSGRMAVDVSANQPTWVYVQNESGQVFRSTDNGLNFTLQGTRNVGGAPYYAMDIAVSQANANILDVAGLNHWQSTNAGVSWTQIGEWNNNAVGGTLEYVHADHHYLVYNGSTLYSCNDGGIYTRPTGGTWTDLTSTLRISQLYRMGGSQTNANLIYTGLQDNGSNRWQSPTNFTQVFGADGMETAVDPSNNNTVYINIQYGSLRRSFDGGNTFTGIAPSGGQWVTPFEIDPNNSNTVYFGGSSSLYKSTNQGTNWTNLNSGAGNRQFKIAPSNSNIIYAANSNLIKKTINGGTTWTTITGTLPVGANQITYLDISSNDPDHVWLTMSGYTAADKVFETTNGGTTWNNISAGLPNVPTNCVVYDQGSADDGVYVGNDIGVYYRDNTTAGWVVYSDGLPNVVILELEIFAPGTANALLRAASYGRGIWESDLYGDDCPVDLVLAGNISGTQDFDASNSVTSTHNLVLPADIEYSAGNFITLNPGFNVPLGATFDAVMNGCTPKMADPVSGSYEWVDIHAADDPMGIGSLEGFAVTTFPNPFQGLAHIAYNLPTDMKVQVEVYDARLKRVATLVNGERQSEGTHTVDFHADHLAGAVYFIKITAGDRQSVHKIMKHQ